MLSTLLDRLTSPTTMIDAEQELLALGVDAVPILASVLSGQAKNEFGVPYRVLELPLRCALEAAIRLGLLHVLSNHFYVQSFTPGTLWQQWHLANSGPSMTAQLKS
jgi:hypothetical protein